MAIRKAHDTDLVHGGRRTWAGRMCVIEWSRWTVQAPEDAPRGLEKVGEALDQRLTYPLVLRPSIRTA
jgi:hypothetical protein